MPSFLQNLEEEGPCDATTLALNLAYAKALLLL